MKYSLFENDLFKLLPKNGEVVPDVTKDAKYFLVPTSDLVA